MYDQPLHVPSERFDAAIFADVGAGRDASLRAVDLAGGRTRFVQPLVEAAAIAGIERGLLIVDLADATGASVNDALDQVADAATHSDAQLIVAIDKAQLDAASMLIGARLQLLCEPSMAERATAVTIAANRTGLATLHDVVREGGPDRFDRLNAEVTRIAEVVARLTRNDVRSDPVSVAEAEARGPQFDAGPPPPIDPLDVRGIIRARRLRDRYFGEGLFEDPAWDMMLDLFAAHLERGQVSVSSLCIAAAVAPTTALRWIARMTDAGLFVRQPDPFDRRRAFMDLSPQALSAMYRYMSAIRQPGGYGM